MGEKARDTMTQTLKVSSRTLTPPKAAAVAGVIFSILMIVSLGILRVAVPADLTRPGIWLSDPGHRNAVSLALNLVPFAGIAFLWLMGVLRNRLGAFEDQFFATVFFGSGLLFVASVFASGAAAGAFVKAVEAGGIQPANDEIYYFVRRVSYIFMNVFGIKMAGVFMFSTCTIVLRTGILPRWVAFLGFACGLILLLVITNWEWIALLFPAWILIVSGQILTSDLWNRKTRESKLDSSSAEQ
jgi:hypothetical protein